MGRLGETERFARFATEIATFAPEVIEQGKRMLLDQFACQIAGATLPWSRAYRDAMTMLGTGGEATVVYYGDAVALDQAAFLNSAFGHANEYDDTHLGAAMHPGSIVIPAVTAIARGASSLRPAGTGSDDRRRRGDDPDRGGRGTASARARSPRAVVGGAVRFGRRVRPAAGSRCRRRPARDGDRGQPRERTDGVFADRRIGEAHPLRDPGRRGVAVGRDGHGITGPRTILEGERGFFVVFPGACDTALLVGGLGEDYQLLATSFKPFACNLSTHGALEALADLVDEHGLTAGDVAAIEIGTSSSAVRDIGAIVEPDDVLGAQTSFAFGTAVRLLRGGNGPNDYHEADLRDPRFLQLARRVRLFVDPVCDEERKTLRNRSAVVTVRTNDGRALERRVRFPKGSPERPLSTADVFAKFADAVTPQLGAARAAELADRIWNIEALDDMATLLPLTQPFQKVPNIGELAI